MNQELFGKICKKYISRFILAAILVTLVFPFGGMNVGAQVVDPNTGCTVDANGTKVSCPDQTAPVQTTQILSPNDDGYLGTQGQNDQYTQFFQNQQNQQTQNGSNSTPPNDAPQQTYTGNTPSSNSQAATYVNGQAKSGSGSNSTAGSLASCLGGDAAASFIKQKVLGFFDSDKYTHVNTTSQNDSAHSGSSSGFPPSFDSIGYCLINEIIAKVANDTIAWINSGFNGNPAFVSDPEKFFTDIADQQASQFISQVAYGATGLNICKPFKINIATDLNRQYNQGFAGASACSLGDIENNFKSYTSGGPSSGSLSNWFKVTQVPANNRFGASILAQDELQKRISVKQNTATLDLTTGNGFLSYKECEPSTSDQSGNIIKGKCTIKTPGKVIESQLNNRLSSGNNRLVLADKFDQVLSALVQQLIKTALNKALGATSGN